MCGIAGIYNFGNKKEIQESELIRMRETLEHRGPDGGANYISPDGKVGLAQRRLAIIDLHPEAACPMPNEDGTIWITFNGEIYNFKALREELKEKGHTFRSEGDTETILHGYEEFGPDIVKKLNGMFAFVIWDDAKKTLFAARDHVGIKPFYYSIQGNAFYFGSEIKAVLAHPDFKKELNETGLAHYLAFSATPAPHTLFKDVYKLPPAHYLTLDQSGVLRTVEYWNPLDPAHKVPEKRSEKFYVEVLRHLLKDSIKGQMVSDVPFGCFLSGGIDSSLNAALMSEALGKPVETFTIGSSEHAEVYNEFEYSRLMADRLGANKHERMVDFQAFLDFLPQYGKFADDPNGDPTCFLVYYLSELVREKGVVVVQTGEGGDELFAGYTTYKRADDLYGTWQLLSKLPYPIRQMLHDLARFLKLPEFFLDYTGRLARGEEPFWGHAIAFSTAYKEKLLNPRLRKEKTWNQDYEVIDGYYKQAKKISPKTNFLNRMGYLELKMRLGEFLLMRVDKFGMSHSIEGRVPFLDYRIVELALNLPKRVKLHGGDLKHMLKRVSLNYLPKEIIKRKKQGFGSPVTEWFRDPERSEILLQKILGSKLMEKKFFEESYIRELFSEHRAGENHTFRLMNLLTLALWYDHWF